MFKNGTVAFAVVMMVVGSPAQAASGINCSMYEEKIADATISTTVTPAKIQDLKKLRDECYQRQTAEVGDCSRAESNYVASVKDLQDSCDSLGLRASSQTGSIGCSFNIDQCKCAAKGLKEVDKEYLGCNKGVDVSKLSYCPQVSEAAQDRMEKRRDKADGQLEKLKDKLRSLDDDASKTDDKIADAKRQARQARAAAEKEYSQGIAELKQAKNAKEQERIQKMSEFEEKMQSAQTALRAQPLKDRNASRKLDATKSQIYLQCVSQAQAAVNTMQTDAVSQIHNGTYNRGTSNEIFRQVGLTDRQNWQREVNKRVGWCMASPETKTAQDQANTQLAADMDGNKTEADDAKAQLEMLKRQMDQIQAACTGGAKAANGETVQSQSCRDQEDSNAKLQSLNENHKTAFDAAQADEDDAKAAADKAEATLKKKKGELTNEIVGQQMLLGQMDAADTANASYPTPSSGGSSQERAKMLSDKYAKAIDHAQRINRCCDQSNSSISSSSCTGAKGFLKEHGLDGGSSTTASSTNSTTPPPSRSGTSGTDDTGAHRAE